MGAINDPVMMENILASGKADVIYITGAIYEGYHAVLDIWKKQSRAFSKHGSVLCLFQKLQQTISVELGGGGEVAVFELVEVDSADAEIIQHIQKHASHRHTSLQSYFDFSLQSDL